MRHELADQAAAIIRERLAALTVKSFDELAALPNTSTEELLRDGTKMFVSVWHDVLERASIALQCRLVSVDGWPRGEAVPMVSQSPPIMNGAL